MAAVLPKSRAGEPASPRWSVPADGATYPESLIARGAGGDDAAIRLTGLMMVVAIIAAYAVIIPLVNLAITWLGFAASSPDRPWSEYADASRNFGTVWGVVAAHLGLAALILVVWGFYRFWHHRRLAWLWSVWPGVRWRFAAMCLVAAVVVIGAVAVFQWTHSGGWRPESHWGWYVVAIICTTPLQAVAEEVMFRGYLMQALGGIVHRVWFPIVGTAVIFAVFHGTQDPLLFADRLVFGLIAGVLVWRTGGLEAGIAIHIVNNLAAFALATFSGTLVSVRMATTIGWSQAGMDIGMFAVAAVVCWLVGRGLRVPLRASTR